MLCRFDEEEVCKPGGVFGLLLEVLDSSLRLGKS